MTLTGSEGAWDVTINPVTGGPCLQLDAGHYDEAVLKFLTRYRTTPGATIRGLNRTATIIKVPVDFNCPFPEISDVTVHPEGAVEDLPHGACVTFENPQIASSNRLWIQHRILRAWCMVDVQTLRGRPDGHIGWPFRGEEKVVGRSSTSEHIGLHCYYSGGGGILAWNQIDAETEERWKEEGDRGCWSNHLRLIGGHVKDVTKWDDVKGWWTRELGMAPPIGSVDWAERFYPLPAYEIRSHAMELYTHHADVFPNLGALVKDVGGGEKGHMGWMGTSYCEAVIKNDEKHKADWYPDQPDPPWIIGGDRIKKAKILELVGGLRHLDAEGFSAVGWLSGVKEWLCERGAHPIRNVWSSIQ